MKHIDWDPAKNIELQEKRKVSFEEVEQALDEGRLITIIPHWNPKRYPNQKVFIVLIKRYVYLVPFVEDEEKIFLKTIFPSRKATKQYL